MGNVFPTDEKIFVILKTIADYSHINSYITVIKRLLNAYFDGNITLSWGISMNVSMKKQGIVFKT